MASLLRPPNTELYSPPALCAPPLTELWSLEAVFSKPPPIESVKPSENVFSPPVTDVPEVVTLLSVSDGYLYNEPPRTTLQSDAPEPGLGG